MNRIFSVVSQFGEAASSLVVMSPLAQKKIAEMIERDIGNPEIHVRAVNEKFLLEGVASSENEKTRSEIIAKTYVPDVVVEAAESAGVVKKRKLDSVINLLGVRPPAEQPPSKTIKLIVHYVELQKDYDKSFKFQWMPSLKDDSGVQFSSNNQNAGGGLVTSITGTINNLLPSLNFAKAHGFARVLKSSTMIVEEGNPGIIRSITRIPYSVQNQYGQLSTAFEEAGIDTNITPKLVNAKSDRIAMTVVFSLKSLIGQTEKGPLVSNNTIQTRVTVRSNQSAP
jgi:pilus assembly protein CpaC